MFSGNCVAGIQLLLLFLLSSSLVSGHSPYNRYSPGVVTCPYRNTFIRKADDISNEEKQWLLKRNVKSQASLRDFLKYSTNLNESEYTSLIPLNSTNYKDSVKIGISFSGGGFRAMLCGAGELSALDNRTNNAFEKGLGGLLQATTYFAGLSGGNWLLGTLAVNNWISVQDVIKANKFWQLQRPLYEVGPAKHFRRLTFRAWVQWMEELKLKHEAGFEISFVDIWAKALSTRFLLTSLMGKSNAQTWSGIRNLASFKEADMPFPISVSEGKYNRFDLTISNSSVFESNPFEFGTWDPNGQTFTDIKYLGSEYVNGTPVGDRSCVAGYDSAAFIMAASSNIFDMGVGAARDAIEKVSLLYRLFKRVFNQIDTRFLDDAIIKPNPFYQSKWGTSKAFTNNNYLTLVDGGQDMQNVPIVPLTVPERDVDILILFDNSADTDDLWPNATALQYTYNRQFEEVGKAFSFPYIPPEKTFVEKGFNKKPTFFGCDAKNLTGLSSIPPLVVYNGNREYSFQSNFSTMQMSYADDVKLKIIQNGFEVASRNNLTDGADYRTCLGCAIIRRKQEKLGIEQSEQCKKCFAEYCWDGTL